jgi:hypothetical protein
MLRHILTPQLQLPGTYEKDTPIFTAWKSCKVGLRQQLALQAALDLISLGSAVGA